MVFYSVVVMDKIAQVKMKASNNFLFLICKELWHDSETTETNGKNLINKH